jgi:hypothetical protein
MEDIKHPKQLLEYRPVEDLLADNYRDYWAIIIVRLKQVIYWPNFVNRIRKGSFNTNSTKSGVPILILTFSNMSDCNV